MYVNFPCYIVTQALLYIKNTSYCQRRKTEKLYKSLNYMWYVTYVHLELLYKRQSNSTNYYATLFSRYPFSFLPSVLLRTIYTVKLRTQNSKSKYAHTPSKILKSKTKWLFFNCISTPKKKGMHILRWSDYSPDTVNY